MSIFRRNSGNATSAHDMLKEINKLSSALRGGMNPAAAAQIAQTTRSILKGTSVAVTDDTSILGISGTTVAWDEAVLEQTAGILDRRRLDRPTVYEITLPNGAAEVVAVALATDDVPIGTIHVLAASQERRLGSELQELAALVEWQLQLLSLIHI